MNITHKYSVPSILKVITAIALFSLVATCSIPSIGHTAVGGERVKVNVRGYTFKNAKYLSTYDGDTFFVDVNSIHPIFGKRLGVRIRGIDTLEIRNKDPIEKALAFKAKAFTQSMLEGGKRLRLSNCLKGSFSRIVCDVRNTNTNDLGSSLLRNGHATIYSKK